MKDSYAGSSTQDESHDAGLTDGMIVVMSHKRNVRSHPPETRLCPSGEKDKHSTRALLSLRIATHTLLLTSNTRIWDPSPVQAIVRPS
jgi:hypothetical protein